MGDFMKGINFAISIGDIVRKLNEDRGKMGSWAQLSIPPESLPSLRRDPGLETLFQRLLQFALLKNKSGRPVQVVFCRRTKMLDMENQFALSPLFWIHARIKAPVVEGFDTGIKGILRDLGYRCNKWIAGNDSDSGLGAFGSGKDREVRLIAWIQNGKSYGKCDFLIPVKGHNALQSCGNYPLHSRTCKN
jgi:hypothetical protein